MLVGATAGAQSASTGARMFVQLVRNGELSGGRLVLHGVGGRVI
jgi:hypothetical protein